VANNGFFVEPEIGIGKAITNSITISNKKADDELINVTKDWDKNDYLPILGNKIGLDLRIAFKIGKRF